MPLPEERRQQLDGIVQQMVANGEPEENVRFVVDDFKQKYGNYPEQPSQPAKPPMSFTDRLKGAALGSVAGSAVLPGPGTMLGAIHGAGYDIPDYYAGAAKGLASTAIGLGDIVDRGAAALGIGDRDAQAFQTARDMVAPQNESQALGQGVEQMAEFMAVPGPAKFRGVATLADMARGAAGAGTLALAQGASDEGAIASAVMGGAPIVPAVAAGAKHLSTRAVRSVIKPTVAAMRRISGESTTEGLNGAANNLVAWIIRTGVTTPEKARKVFTAAEQELQRILAVRNAPTDAPTRALKYLDALERSAAKQAMPSKDVAVLRGAAEEVLAGTMGTSDVPVSILAKITPTSPLPATGQGAKAGSMAMAIKNLEAGKKFPVDITIMPDGSQVVSGGRHTLAAAQQLGIESLPIRVMTPNGRTLTGAAAREELGLVGRVARRDMTAREALESARSSSKWNTRGKFGAKDQAEAASGVAFKAVEKAQRDAVKAAVPEIRRLLNTERQAIQAEQILDRAALREGNQNLTGIAGPVAVGTTNPAGGVLAFAGRLLREGQLGGGVLVGQLARAVQEGNASKAAFFLQMLGLGGANQVIRGSATASAP